MKLISNILIVVLIAIFGMSCATIISGTSQDIYINSNPEGATIYDGGLKVGKTPATITVKKSGFNDKEISLSLEGHERRTFILKKSFDAVAILNLAGILGWAVDFATGAVFKYDRTNYDLDLDPNFRPCWYLTLNISVTLDLKAMTLVTLDDSMTLLYTHDLDLDL